MQLFEDRDNDWALDELPQVYGLIGPQAIPALSEYLLDAGHETWPRVTAADGLSKIASAHPDHREACIAALTETLGYFIDNEDFLNGLSISHLLDLKAVEAAPLMEQAFAAEMVDESIPGTWAAVQVDLGNDIAGSVRQPAHFCGVYGLKPTDRRISTAGQIPEVPGMPVCIRQMMTVGCFARSLEDLKLCFSLIAGADDRALLS